MPPRKSATRRSDVSMARFAPIDDVDVSTISATSVADSPAQAPPTEKKDQEKEPSPTDKEPEKSKEKEKEKEKEKSSHPDATTIEDLNLPKSIITRLAKGVLPPNTQIQANAILALSNSTTVFINYLASHANEHTVNAGKKTIAPADVFKALEETEFSFLRAPLEAEFAKFNAIQTEKRTSYRQKVRAKKGPDTEMADTSIAEEGDTTIASEALAPRAKKQRVDAAATAAAEAREAEEDAETEEDEAVDEEEEGGDEVDEEEDEEEEGDETGDETQDALEEKHRREDGDEALDGDDSD